ncbi:MAG: hypothetical protein HY974_01905 [Candidatus Kerfeldbacteria bacterium]|nr:hypothetical protein [Candidatus Kerfeldbacteria bacterium]
MPKEQPDSQSIKKLEDYKDSILYRVIQDDISKGDLKSALKLVHSLGQAEYMSGNESSMLDVLIQAYESGDTSPALVEQFRSTVEKIFQELQNKGLIHQTGKRTIESVPLPRPENDEPVD